MTRYFAGRSNRLRRRPAVGKPMGLPIGLLVYVAVGLMMIVGSMLSLPFRRLDRTVAPPVRFHRNVLIPAGLAMALLHPQPAFASDRRWAQASDIGRDVLVAASLGIPAVQSDWQGDLQAAGSMAAAGGATFVMKELIDERRPDGSDDRSFPSGHTSLSFAAAVSLEKRYGWRAGVPALVVTSFVGLARVQASKHYVHDVLAGAAIGSVSGWLLTSRHDETVRLVPWGGRHGGGLGLAARF
ncbi:phosphatase PAP2 family protein [Sphingomonas sp. CD22]|uniref:phosphatase PAP2 family protein n=1 Tax=Sphingomonas sp. CD22 TaxID=3100214 RepID=UPI002AE0229B|nr:phosphatase PAP2 family protein [Sphingomonas sp. CD22]MEA1086342.1 phosphatase PAP2 family protein [Sphingomonas sp. CD22]